MEDPVPPTNLEGETLEQVAARISMERERMGREIEELTNRLKECNEKALMAQGAHGAAKLCAEKGLPSPERAEELVCSTKKSLDAILESIRRCLKELDDARDNYARISASEAFMLDLAKAEGRTKD